MKKSFILTGTILGSLLAGTTAMADSHEIQKSDNLYELSKQYNINVQELKKLNNLEYDVNISGQILKAEAKVETKAKEEVYTVVAGDSLSQIAKQYKTTVTQLLQLNPEISDKDFIQIGQKIKIAGVVVEVPAKQKGTVKKATVAEQPKQKVEQDTASQPKQEVQQDTVSQPKQEVQQDTESQPKEEVQQAPVTSTASAESVIAAGEKYLGKPYLYGASTSRSDAFDCSSFTVRAFKEGAGITLPRTSREQANVGTNVSLDSLQKGDLVFFDNDFNGTIDHVGIYAGNGQMINAASSKGISYADIHNSYWGPRLVKATRVL